MKTGAILQSNYIPWKGYFDIIRAVDLFIFHDDLQYTKGDWRNRNKIKTPLGSQWLTIPCGNSEKRLICEVKLTDHAWQKKHWQIIMQHYGKARYFSYFKPFFEEIYLGKTWVNLSCFNQFVIKKIAIEILHVKTEFTDSRDYHLNSKKAERVLELVQKAGISHYISGPSAKNYISSEFMSQSGITLEWMDYSNYSEYNQLFPPFDHHVSIIDLIFNEGDNSLKYMKDIAT